MGQDCCTNRVKENIYPIQSKSASRTDSIVKSSLMHTAITPFKISMAIALLYLAKGEFANLQTSLQQLIELGQQCGKKTHICYFEPNYLQKHFGLVEFQSPGQQFSFGCLADAFWADLDYFYEEGICQEILQFKVMIIIEIQNKGSYVLSLSRKLDESNTFVLYDCFNRTKTYRERLFPDEQSLNSALNKLGEFFINAFANQSLSIKLLTFDVLAEATLSDVDSVNTDKHTHSSNRLADLAYIEINVDSKTISQEGKPSKEQQKTIEEEGAGAAAPIAQPNNTNMGKDNINENMHVEEEKLNELEDKQTDYFKLPPSLVTLGSNQIIDGLQSKLSCSGNSLGNLEKTCSFYASNQPNNNNSKLQQEQSDQGNEFFDLEQLPIRSICFENVNASAFLKDHLTFSPRELDRNDFFSQQDDVSELDLGFPSVESIS